DTLAQLDQLMPVADRQKGSALARVKAKTAPGPSSKPNKPVRMAQAKPPASKQAPQAATAKPAPVAAASGAWRIQLGAFSQRGAAEALYRQISTKPALAG